jgi:putative flippase GtrA
MRSEFGRLVRFGIVGVTNTLLTLAVFTGLIHAGVSAPLASSAGFIAGAINGYMLNGRWTFRGADLGAGPMARYLVVQALGAGLSGGGIALVTADLAVARLAAELLVLPAVSLITYILSSRLVFRTVGLA